MKQVTEQDVQDWINSLGENRIVMTKDVADFANAMIDKRLSWIEIAKITPTNKDADERGDVLLYNQVSGRKMLCSVDSVPNYSTAKNNYTHWQTPPPAMNKRSKTKQLITYMRQHRTIDAVTAWELFDVYRVASIITNLRNMYGWHITANTVRLKTGKRHTTYEVIKIGRDPQH